MIFERDYDTKVPNNVILMTVLYQEPYNHKVPYVSQKNPFYQFHVGIICSNEFHVNVHDKRYSRELRIRYF